MDILSITENEIHELGNSTELEYFNFHQGRFARFGAFLTREFPNREANRQLKVLDIGSHYLVNAMMLSAQGFEVHGMDVSTFWEMDFVRERGEKFRIQPIIENDLAAMPTFQGMENQYDLVVFTEIMEHITFNPVSFWKTIYQLLKPGGKIYISTPNALALANWMRGVKNLFTFKSMGISVDDILSKVTYGHHWKEYSAAEIREYFGALSSDFEMTINPYHYKKYELKPPFLAYKILSKLGNQTNLFAEELEVIVTLPQKSSWKMEIPTY